MSIFFAACAASAPLPGTTSLCPTTEEYIILGILIGAAALLLGVIFGWALLSNRKERK